MSKHSTRVPIGGYAWRKARNLLTISDHVRRYRAVRVSRGPYSVPLPGDLISSQFVLRNREVAP